jgi:putative ABC transport system ATP-binding protein
MSRRLRFKPKALSGGEKQRVSIARALANSPELILADEPTANLDSRHGHEVVALLRSVAKDLGHTVVIVSHDQRICDVADRVLWLEDGRLQEMSQMAKDPVCSTAVTENAGLALTYAGQDYFFCSDRCRQEFQGAPARFGVAGLTPRNVPLPVWKRLFNRLGPSTQAP